MPRTRSRSRSRSKSKKTTSEFVCPYRKHGEQVRKMSKTKIVNTLMKKLKVSTKTKAGKDKKRELSKVPVTELRNALHSMLNSEYDAKMAKKMPKMPVGIRRGRGPGPKSMMGPGMGPGMGMGRGKGMGMGPGDGVIKIIACRNGYCQMYSQPFKVVQSGRGGQVGGGDSCPVCGMVGTWM